MMATSWQALPGGHVVALNRTQELLLDMLPAIEDLVITCRQLECVQRQAADTRREAHELVIRSRRQRLGLRLIQRSDTP